MNHEWSPEVQRAMVAIDDITPEPPDVMARGAVAADEPRRPRRALLATAAAVVAIGGGLGLLATMDSHDTATPAVPVTTVDPHAFKAICEIATNPLHMTAENITTLIDYLLLVRPEVLDPAVVRQCKQATAAELARIQSIIEERRAVTTTG
jgi:hypothetical protein